MIESDRVKEIERKRYRKMTQNGNPRSIKIKHKALRKVIKNAGTK